jgi:hypothetical protein
VLESIEALPPGLYGMEIAERKDTDGKPAYDVSFVELRLEDIAARLNRFKRADEKPFEAVNVVAELNQRVYELFGRPLAQALSNEYVAKLARAFHPLRLQRWAFSDLNPWLWWLAPTAQAVKAERQALGADDPARRVESMVSELTSASLDCYRGLRDMACEAAFFQIYGNLSAFYLGEGRAPEGPSRLEDPRELPFVKKALAAIDRGGYPEALARVAFLLAHEDGPLPLARVQLAQELLNDYRDLLPDLALDEVRRIGGEQEIIARYEPERAIETLPTLLADRADRDRLLTLLERVLADERVQSIQPSAEQTAMLARIRQVLGASGGSRAGRRRGAAAARSKVATARG